MQQIQNAANWLETQIRANPFSDVGVSFSVHNGLIVRVTKTISAKEMSENKKEAK